MASETVVSETVDPLGELNGPLLFPRTIRASTDRPFPADSRGLESIHNFMKSLELRSPEKLMNEAKRIVDGGAELLESSLASFTEKVDISNAVAAKGKDRAQERRPGLGRARKKGSFSLKASQPTVSLESSLNINQLQDPDEFFDAYERLENAKKEIQKQLGGSMDNVNQYNSSTNARRRRPGILGKSYNIKHRYSSAAFQNDDILMSSQESVEQGIPSAHKDESQVNLMQMDLNPHVDLEEVELAGPMKKTENDVSEILEELLSCNAEDLDGDGALNLLQERFKIKPLDLENLGMPQLHGIRGTSSLSVGDSLLKSRKSSLIIDSVLKDVNNKSNVERNPVSQNSLNGVSSPTPPRSPFASLSLLQKKLWPSNHLRDPFSPLDVDVSACDNTSPVLIDKLQDQVGGSANLSMSSELKCRSEVEIKEPNMNTSKVGSLHDQVVDGSIQRANADNRSNEVPTYNTEETVDFENLHDTKSSSSIIIDAHKVVGNIGGFPDQFVDENASIQRANADHRPSEVVDNNLVEMMNSEDFNGMKSPSSIINDALKVVDINFADKFVDENAGIQQANADNRVNEQPSYNTAERMNLENLNACLSKPSVLHDEVMEDPSSRQLDAEQQPQVPQIKLQRGRRKAGEKHIKKARSTRMRVADDLEDEATDDPSSRQDIGLVCESEASDVPLTGRQADLEQPPEVNQAIPKNGKRDQAGEKRIRKAHPMRKSIAESGTSFETGVRRSKRIRMRPLEYWKGERFLYGRMDESLKLIGVKYISPGKGNGDLKVKPYISSESSGYKELLELAARH